MTKSNTCNFRCVGTGHQQTCFCWSLDHCNFHAFSSPGSSPKGLVSATRMTRTLPCHGGAMLCAICDSSGSLNEALDLDLWWSSASRVHPFRLVSWLVDSKCEESYKTPRCGMVFGMSGCTTQASQTSCLLYKLLSFNETHSILCCIHFKHTWPWESVLSKAGYAFYKSSQFIGYQWNINQYKSTIDWILSWVLHSSQLASNRLQTL